MRAELPGGPRSAAAARRLVHAECDGTGVDVDAALLCTSELVTNAVLHGRPPVVLEVVVSSSSVRVEVHDGDLSPVVRRRPVDRESSSGRGLELVAALAERWGSEATPGGKVTWFELPGTGHRS